MTNKVSVSVGITLNLGNYESLRIDLSQESEVEGSPAEARKKLFDKLESELTNLAQQARSELKA